MKLDPIRVEILREALMDSDDIFVAVFEEPITPHEEALEREATRMADEGLLSAISPGQYRVTALGRSALQTHDRTPLRKAAEGVTSLAKQTERNYVRPIVVGVISAVIATLFLILIGVSSCQGPVSEGGRIDESNR